MEHAAQGVQERVTSTVLQGQGLVELSEISKALHDLCGDINGK